MMRVTIVAYFKGGPAPIRPDCGQVTAKENNQSRIER